MTREGDFDSLATSSRTARARNRRARQAARVLARTQWLDARLVFWSGVLEGPLANERPLFPPQELPRERLESLPAGLYAIPFGRLTAVPVEPVTREKIAATARAIEALSSYPNVGARLVGSIAKWRREAATRLGECRRAAEGASAWTRRDAGALAVEARALWLGSGPRPSETLSDDELSSWTAHARERDETAGCLAAVELGRRRSGRRCAAPLAPWAAAGRALNRWPAAEVASLATVVGPEALQRIAVDSPGLNDSMAVRWLHERQRDATPISREEIAGLAHLLARIEANHDSATVHTTPAVDALVAAGRVRLAPPLSTCELLARWIETARPILAPATFWSDLLTVVPLSVPALEPGASARFADSLTRLGERIATALATGPDGHAAPMRRALPAVLTRGPAATDLALRHGLWLTDEEGLATALRWASEIERVPTRGAADAVPSPHAAFRLGEPAVRDAVLDLGLRVWRDGRAGASDTEHVLWLLSTAASRGAADCLAAALPRLGDVAVHLSTRLLASSPDACTRSVDGAALLVTILDVCARWQKAGFTDAMRLARLLADRWPSCDRADREWDRYDLDRAELLVGVSEGRIPRFLALLDVPQSARAVPWRAVDGWTFVTSHATAHGWVSACLDRTELAARVLHLLDRIALIARLDPSQTAARFFRPLNARGPGGEWPDWVAMDDRAALDGLARAASIADPFGALPGSVRRVLGRVASDRTELAALRTKAVPGQVRRSEQARLDRLEALVANPSSYVARLRSELHRVLPKQAALTGLAAIEALAAREMERHWRAVLGATVPRLDTAQWDHALHMLLSVSHNRRVLTRLLRHAARGDHTWMRDLAPNRDYLAALAEHGVNADQWLKGRTRTTGPGGNLTVYATTDPLEVLQMGSLFGTCLSAGHINAHAAVAAAVEANKRVLFVRDQAGRILGRQLLALTSWGELVGFKCYGAAAEGEGNRGAWVKLALALLALDICRASGARLMPADHLASGLDDASERSLMLFCHGYVDTPEPFDWWIEALARANPQSGEADRQLVSSCLEMPGGYVDRTGRRVHDDGANHRARLWLAEQNSDTTP